MAASLLLGGGIFLKDRRGDRESPCCWLLSQTFAGCGGSAERPIMFAVRRPTQIMKDLEDDIL